jgi:hypothetical protein
VRRARRCGAPGFRAAFASLTLAVLTTAAAPAARGQRPDAVPQPRHGLWVGLGFGGGQAEHWSDQEPRSHATVITASLRGGVVLTPHLRLGIEADGWGLEASGYDDPAKGVSINQTLLIVQFYPWAARDLYIKAGYGIGGYQDHHPDGWGSRAFGAVTVGAGYDLRVSRTVSLTVAADWARGPMGSVANLVTTSTGRRFRAWDVILGVQYH